MRVFETERRRALTDGRNGGNNGQGTDTEND